MKPRDTGALRTIAGTTIIVDFISLIQKIGLEKYPKVKYTFDGACGTIFAVSNLDRIGISYDTYLEVSFKESTRTGRAKEEPTEIINLNLDSPVPPEIKANLALAITEEHRQILSRNYFLIKGKEKEKDVILSG